MQDFLTGLGCTSLQGFHFARPQPLCDWMDSLARERSDSC